MSNFQPAIPILYTDQLQETIDFYVSIGFTCREQNADWGWAALMRDACEIMLYRPTDVATFEKPHFTGSLYIRVENVDSLWNDFRGKAEVCYEPETFDWGMREFAIYDNNGYLLQFGEETLEAN